MQVKRRLNGSSASRVCEGLGLGLFGGVDGKKKKKRRKERKGLGRQCIGLVGYGWILSVLQNETEM